MKYDWTRPALWEKKGYGKGHKDGFSAGINCGRQEGASYIIDLWEPLDTAMRQAVIALAAHAYDKVDDETRRTVDIVLNYDKE